MAAGAATAEACAKSDEKTGQRQEPEVGSDMDDRPCAEAKTIEDRTKDESENESDVSRLIFVGGAKAAAQDAADAGDAAIEEEI